MAGGGILGTIPLAGHRQAGDNRRSQHKFEHGLQNPACKKTGGALVGSQVRFRSEAHPFANAFGFPFGLPRTGVLEQRRTRFLQARRWY